MPHLRRLQKPTVHLKFFLFCAVLGSLALLSAPNALAQEVCDPNPCQNGGLCSDDGRGNPTCRCPADTDGEFCEIVNDVCDPNPCANGGTCSDLGGGDFACECPVGTTGDFCEEIVDLCDPNPCQNNGLCESTSEGGIICRCDIGFTGDFCELLDDACDPNPCQNGGSCTDFGFGDFACECPAGTSGDLCEVVDNGGDDVCDPNPCLNGGQCDESDAGAICRCPAGFSGEFCQDFGDACAGNLCQNDSTCVDNGDGTFACECLEGFEGDFCETEVGPPGVCNPSPCLNGGNCFDFNGQAFCSCVNGFTGQFCETAPDSCFPDPCLNDGLCTDNGDGTFFCDCPPDFAGEVCDIDISDPCDPNPCNNDGICLTDGESLSCDCADGFSGEFCDIVNVDVGLGTFFDEGSGTVTDFRSGGPGTVSDLNSWGTGQQGASFLGFGASYAELVDSGVSEADITGPLTLMAWVKPAALGGTQMIISKDNVYELEIGKVADDVWNLRLDNVVVGQGSTTLENGFWYHLAASWDGETVTYYVNGLEDGTAGFNGVLSSNDENLGVGARPTAAIAGGPTFFFVGNIDDARIYDRALDATEIASIVAATLNDITPPVISRAALTSSPFPAPTTVPYGIEVDETATCRYSTTPGVAFDDMTEEFTNTSGNLFFSFFTLSDGINPFFARCRDGLGNTNQEDFDFTAVVGAVDVTSNLVGDWSFDEGVDCTTADATGGNDGTLGPDCIGGNAPQWIAGVSGSALAFDGIDDVVTASSAGIQTPTELTISAWVRRPATTRFESIVDLRDAGADGFDLYYNNASQLFIRVNDGTLAGNAIVADGTWHHVVGVYDGSDLRLYVDSVLDASAFIGSKTIDVSDTVLSIGRHYSVNSFTNSGDIDNVKIYSRALSDLEVFQVFLDSKP